MYCTCSLITKESIFYYCTLYLVIFNTLVIMEIFDRGNIRKGQPFANLFTSNYLRNEDYWCEDARINKTTVLPQYMLRCYQSFFYNDLELETMPTFHRLRAASIKTIRLSHKDCLAGYRYEKVYEKVAVISEQHTYIVGSYEVLKYQTQQRHHFAHLPCCTIP